MYNFMFILSTKPRKHRCCLVLSASLTQMKSSQQWKTFSSIHMTFSSWNRGGNLSHPDPVHLYFFKSMNVRVIAPAGRFRRWTQALFTPDHKWTALSAGVNAHMSHSWHPITQTTCGGGLGCIWPQSFHRVYTKVSSHDFTHSSDGSYKGTDTNTYRFKSRMRGHDSTQSGSAWMENTWSTLSKQRDELRLVTTCSARVCNILKPVSLHRCTWMRQCTVSIATTTFCTFTLIAGFSGGFETDNDHLWHLKTETLIVKYCCSNY